MSQLIILQEALKDPLLARNVLARMVANLDRTSHLFEFNDDEIAWRVIPRNYKERPNGKSMLKAKGKKPMSFTCKTDAVISADGELLSNLTVIGEKKLPAGETIKLEVCCSCLF